jgi:hypothetical protein
MDFEFYFLHNCTRLYVDSTGKPPIILTTTLKTMVNAMEIAPNNIILALPPLPNVASHEHAPHVGDGQNLPLASAGIAVAVAPTLQPQQHLKRSKPLIWRGK